MAVAHVNGADLYHELHGEGAPLVLVHGSWADAARWSPVLPGLAASFRVLVYDRRGHSRSEAPAGQGSFDEDGDDLAALLEHLALAPAHVVTSSAGGAIALRLACRRPELFRSLTCHEPPIWELLANDPEGLALVEADRDALASVASAIEAGEHEAAARQFVDEVAFGPGAWEHGLPPDVREMFVANAPTFLDELRDPDQFAVDADALAALDVPVHLTQGTEGPPTYGRALDALEALLPRVSRESIEGAGHAPQATHPDAYVAMVTRAVGRTG